MVYHANKRSAVGQQHKLATGASGQADIECFAPVIEGEALRDRDREMPLRGKPAIITELEPPR